MNLPMPGTPAASWAVYRARLKSVFAGADYRVYAAFWLFGIYATDTAPDGNRLTEIRRPAEQPSLCRRSIRCPRPGRTRRP